MAWTDGGMCGPPVTTRYYFDFCSIMFPSQVINILLALATKFCRRASCLRCDLLIAPYEWYHADLVVTRGGEEDMLSVETPHSPL